MTEWPSLSQPSIKIKLHGETEWKYQFKKKTRQEWRVLLPAPPSLSSREHQFLQFTEQVLCCFQPSSHPHVEGTGVSWKSEVYKVYVIWSGGFQVPRNWAGYLGPPGGWNPPVGLELAADTPGYMRWRREKGCWGPGDSIQGLIPVCWALGSSRRNWGASYRTPPRGTRTDDEEERTLGCLPRSATPPASWAAATHSAAAARGCSGSSSPWRRPSAGSKQTREARVLSGAGDGQPLTKNSHGNLLQEERI